MRLIRFKKQTPSLKTLPTGHPTVPGEGSSQHNSSTRPQSEERSSPVQGRPTAAEHHHSGRYTLRSCYQPARRLYQGEC